MEARVMAYNGYDKTTYTHDDNNVPDDLFAHPFDPFDEGDLDDEDRDEQNATCAGCGDFLHGRKEFCEWCADRLGFSDGCED
jgi:hypothetical protein